MRRVRQRVKHTRGGSLSGRGRSRSFNSSVANDLDGGVGGGGGFEDCDGGNGVEGMVFFLALNLEHLGEPRTRTSPKLKHRSGAENQQCLLNCTSVGFPPTKSDCSIALADWGLARSDLHKFRGASHPAETQFRARSTTQKSPLQIAIRNPQSPILNSQSSILNPQSSVPPPSSRYLLLGI
jgi:hypothetical protein